MKCRICSKEIPIYQDYEYRGSIACEEHFDALISIIDKARDQGIYDGEEINHKTLDYKKI